MIDKIMLHPKYPCRLLYNSYCQWRTHQICSPVFRANLATDSLSTEKGIDNASTTHTQKRSIKVQKKSEVETENHETGLVRVKRMISTMTNQEDEEKKKRKQSIIDRYIVEKDMFGPLLKTRKMSPKVSNVQKKVNNNQVDRDPELNWALYHTKKKYIKIIHPAFFDKINVKSAQVLSLNNNAIVSDNTKAITNDLTEDAPNHDIQASSKCEQENNPQQINTSNVAKKYQKPPDIVVKNIFTFPVENRKCSLINTENVTETIDILSIPRMKSKNDLRLSSVTHILNETMSPESRLNLHMWKMRMVKELGEEGFMHYVTKLKNDGKQLHSCIQNNLLMKEFDVPSQVQPAFESMKSVFDEISDVKVIESYVSHSELKYCGIVDCIATYKGKRYVIDWKKSDRKKGTLQNTYDAPLQIAAYIGAINWCDDYPFSVQNGLVVVIYTSGEPATVLEINPENVQKYWKMWLKRLQQYFVELK